MYYMLRRQQRLGRRLYVATTGSDTTGTGTRTNPYATIAKASTVATAGTTVYVAPGTYGSVYMTGSTGGGTAGNPVTYISSVKWGAVINPGSAAPDWAWYVGNEALNHPDHIRIIGFEITAPTSPIGINVAASDVHVIGCHVHHVHNETSADSAGGGIVLEGYYNDGTGGAYRGTGNAAIGNWVHHIGHFNNSLCHPIYVASPSGYVANNVVYNTGGWGIHLYHGPNGTIVSNNTIFDCQSVDAGAILYGWGPEVTTTSGKVNNNIVRNCNIALNENGVAITGVTWRDNWVLDCNVATDFISGGDAGTTVVNVNPGMINYRVDGLGNYYLDGSSAASTAGTLANSPPDDIDRIGRLRPQPGVGAFRTADVSTPTPPSTPSSALNTKTKVVGAYWPQWEFVYPENIHPGINTLLIAFAVNSGTNGAIRWDGLYNNTDYPHAALDQATFEASIQTARAAGRTVLLSIGGSAITYSIDSPSEVTNFVNSVASLYTAWGGFDGIDWDVEQQVTPTANYLAASRALKDLYGADFAISMSYAGDSDSGTNPTTYKAIASDLESTGELDLATIQYYDYGGAASTSDVLSRVGEMVNTWGVLPAHIGIGVKSDPASLSTSWTTAQMVSMWNSVEATYPTIRGMNLWETIQDRMQNSSAFATTVSTAILT